MPLDLLQIGISIMQLKKILSSIAYYDKIVMEYDFTFEYFQRVITLNKTEWTVFMT